MGLPAMTIIFETAAREAVKRAERGAVGLIVRGTLKENPTVIYTEKDIPEDMAGEIKEQVRLALVGNDSAPGKVVVYAISEEAEDYKEALDYFSLKRVNWLACPTAETDGQTEAVSAWVKEQRAGRNKVKAVLPNTAGNDEGVVNYATESVTVGEKDYTAEAFSARIAGLLAGTAITKSSTFSGLPDVAQCSGGDRAAVGAALDAGKFVLYYDGEKVKVARGVNSLVTPPAGKGKAWKKIKVVETMDMINDDLVLLIEDYYIGKYLNTYNNKSLLLSAVMDYLEALAKEGLLEGYTASLDTEAILRYLLTEGKVTKEEAVAMSETVIKKANTDEKVFLCASMTIADAMEDITMHIAV